VLPHFSNKTTFDLLLMFGFEESLHFCVSNLNEGSLGQDKGNHPTPPWSPTIPLHRGAPQFCENGCSSHNSVAYGGGYGHNWPTLPIHYTLIRQLSTLVSRNLPLRRRPFPECRAWRQLHIFEHRAVRAVCAAYAPLLSGVLVGHYHCPRRRQLFDLEVFITGL
jgi:hypothetical protein